MTWFQNIEQTKGQSTSFSYSEKINSSSSYSWTLTDLNYGTETPPSDTNFAITEGTVITVQPIADLNKIKLDTTNVDLNTWQNFFNYEFDDKKPNSEEEYFLYSSLIVPVMMENNGVETNVFEEEVEFGNIFSYPGEVGISDGIFTWYFTAELPEENITSELINKWEVETGVLVSHEFNWEYTNESAVIAISEKLVLNQQVFDLDDFNLDEAFIILLISIGGISVVILLKFRLIPYFLQREENTFSNINELSDSVKKIISEIFPSNSKWFYSLAISVNSEDVDQIAGPPEKISLLLKYKFLMHPVRFAICHILIKHVRLPTAELREILNIPWSDLSTHTRALVNKKYIHFEKIIIDDKFTQVVSLEPEAEVEFRKLNDLLSDLTAL